MRFFRTDLKRLFAGKALLALCLLAPLLVIGLFSLLVLPMVLSAQSLHINVALLDDDGSETVGMFIHELVYGQQLAELVSIRPVQSLEEGSRLVAQNEVSVLVHIPAGLFEAVRGQDTVEIRLISSAPHALEASLVAMSLEQSLRYVGQGQNQLDLARQILIEQQADTSAADGFLEQTTRLVLLGYMNRQGLIGSDGAVSPLGDFLPVEYYLVAVYVFFAALAMLPLVHLTAHDLNGAILQRGLLQGLSSGRFYLVRILSGTLLITLVLVMLLPASLLLRQANAFLGSHYAPRPSALLPALLLLALTLSALATTIAAWVRRGSVALWSCFYLILLMAVSGGLFVPAGLLPEAVAAIGLWFPLRAGLRLLANTLFAYQGTVFRPDLLRLALFSLVLLPIGYLGVLHREGRL